MSRRKEMRTLSGLCLQSIADNMQSFWMKDYLMKNMEEYNFLYIEGPFNQLAGSLVQELIRILGESHKLNKGNLHLLLQPHLLELSLRSCSGIVNTAIVQLVKVRCKHLTSLDLHSCNRVPAAFLATLIEGLPRLTKLCLADTQCDSSVLAAIGKSCGRLCELDLSRCKKISASSLLSLAYDAESASFCCQALRVLLLEDVKAKGSPEQWVQALCFLLLALPYLEQLLNPSLPEALDLLFSGNFGSSFSGFPTLAEVARARTVNESKMLTTKNRPSPPKNHPPSAPSRNHPPSSPPKNHPLLAPPKNHPPSAPPQDSPPFSPPKNHPPSAPPKDRPPPCPPKNHPPSAPPQESAPFSPPKNLPPSAPPQDSPPFSPPKNLPPSAPPKNHHPSRPPKNHPPSAPPKNCPPSAPPKNCPQSAPPQDHPPFSQPRNCAPTSSPKEGPETSMTPQRLTLRLKKLEDLEENDISKLGSLCPSVEEAAVSLGSQTLSTWSLVQWPQLSRLTLHCPERPERTLEEFLEALRVIGRNLQALSLQNLLWGEDESLFALLTACPNLLTFQGHFAAPRRNRLPNDDVDEPELPPWRTDPLPLPRLHTLRLLLEGESLTQSVFQHHLGGFLVSVLKGSPQIESLSLGDVPAPLDGVFEVLYGSNDPPKPLQRLREVSLCRSNVTHWGATLILRSSRDLRTLDLSNCKEVTCRDHHRLQELARKQRLDVVINWL